MNIEAKKCRQCGELKPIEQFRKYYGGRTGTYTLCKTCEKINSREKYLRNKGDKATALDTAELAKIHSLYERQRACGLKPPRGRDYDSIVGTLDEMLDKYTNHNSTPTELSQWLTCELMREPEYYHEVVYEELCKKYRKVISYSGPPITPIYDDTYKQVLDGILERFDEYEDQYYNTEE